MVEVHVREEQEVAPIGRDLQLRSAASISGTAVFGRCRRWPAVARDHDVRGIHLRPHVFGVDGGDAVGECRQSWHDCIHGLRQHSSMNRKLLLPWSCCRCDAASTAAVEERGNLVLDNIPSVGHAPHNPAR
jgi:hypothetical protein